MEIQGVAPENHFRIPRSALQPGNQPWSVHDNSVRIVPVRVLQRGGDEVFVIGGLKHGETVVVGGIRFATDGMLVRTGPAQAR